MSDKYSLLGCDVVGLLRTDVSEKSIASIIIHPIDGGDTLHSISQKTAFFIVTAVKTSYLVRS
jgi:hypothetical protein